MPNKTVMISFALTPEDRSFLNRAAKERGLSRSELVRATLMTSLKTPKKVVRRRRVKGTK